MSETENWAEIEQILPSELVQFVNDEMDNLIRERDNLRTRAEAAEQKAEQHQAEIGRLRKALDDAGDAIAKVVACCTYGSEEQAKVGAYGISHEAFTLIDTFIRKHGDLLNTLKGGE